MRTHHTGIYLFFKTRAGASTPAPSGVSRVGSQPTATCMLTCAQMCYRDGIIAFVFLSFRSSFFLSKPCNLFKALSDHMVGPI